MGKWDVGVEDELFIYIFIVNNILPDSIQHQ